MEELVKSHPACSCGTVAAALEGARSQKTWLYVGPVEAEPEALGTGNNFLKHGTEVAKTPDLKSLCGLGQGKYYINGN